MAKKETFLMVSLEEDKAKKLAQVISNDSCRKILDCLSSSTATESELAEKLNIPISTVHYNLKHLVESRLVEAEEFHYSQKGKEVLHYSIANKYVIIAPKSASEGIMNKLRSIIPAIAIIGALSLIIPYSSGFIGTSAQSAGYGAGQMMKSAAAPVAEQAVLTATRESADMAAQTAGNAAPSASTYFSSASQFPGIWFAVGAIVCLSIYLFTDYLIKKKASKSIEKEG
ncbi:MAG: helix-turn-helix domain-containing protein [Candidatus Woesearchaeota archaeon]|nr:helix-turn-helix domain-containing protein [Candidatus Woesearchaeota archaeon]